MPEAGRTRRTAQHGRINVFVLLVIAAVVCVPQAGKFLVVEDAFDHADVALVLSGRPISRTLAARDLYKAGKVDEIWVIPEPPNSIEGAVTPAVVEELTRMKLYDPATPQWGERILAASGIPRSKFTLLPEHADGTIVEAQRVQTFLVTRSASSIVLITSKSASRRARYIFRHVLKGDAVRILSSPTPYDLFQAERWWEQPRNALTVVTEYQKFLVNMLTLTLGLRERRA